MERKKIKYLILADSNNGVIYGAFYPKAREFAEEYVRRLEEKRIQVEIFDVINLNKFYLKIKKKK